MTIPEVDQELERLFSVARAATAADAAARDRVRAALALRLAPRVTATRRASPRRAWLAVGAAVVGVCAIALWLATAPHATGGSAPTATPTATAPERAPAGSLASTPVTFETPPPAAVAPSLQTSKPSPSSSHAAEPAQELPLVRRMQQALRSGNPGQALALAAEHARSFPNGTLAEEREGVRAVAKCQLAAPGARAPIFAAFTARFSSSPYVARVKAACQ
jgi:hypothetical protein